MTNRSGGERSFSYTSEGEMKLNLSNEDVDFSSDEWVSIDGNQAYLTLDMSSRGTSLLASMIVEAIQKNISSTEVSKRRSDNLIESFMNYMRIYQKDCEITKHELKNQLRRLLLEYVWEYQVDDVMDSVLDSLNILHYQDDQIICITMD